MNKTDMIEKVLSTIDERTCSDMALKIIKEKSILLEPTNLSRNLIQYLKGLGMQVSTYKVREENTTKFIPNPLIMATYGGEDGPSLMFDGHYDTQAVNPSAWSYDPYGQIINGTLYGRGSVDSKGQLAMMLVAIEAILKAGIKIKGNLILACPPDGEIQFQGWKQIALSGLADNVDWIISGEATWDADNDKWEICLAHYGTFGCRIEVLGVPSHEWRPQREGVHAIWEMEEVISALKEIEFSYQPWKWFKPRLNLLTVRGRQENCSIMGSVFVVPGMSLKSVRQDLKACLDQVAKRNRKLRYNLEVFPYWSPTEVLENDPVIKALSQSITKVTGKEPKLECFQLIYCGAPAIFSYVNPGQVIGKPAPVTFGGGDFRLAHIGNESVPINNLVNTAKIYASTALTLLL
jgi:succinyl-diaminopimelate desuccinylase